METSGKQRILYSLWILPLVPPALCALLMLVTGVAFRGGWSGRGVSVLNLFFGFLVPVSYLFGWITSRERKDRTAFLVVTAGYLALITLFMSFSGLMETTFWASIVLGVLSSLAILAATVCALLRRRRLVERAVLHRSPEQVGNRARGNQGRLDAEEQRMRERATSRRSQPNAQRQVRPVSGGAIPTNAAAPAPQPSSNGSLKSVIGATHATSPQQERQVVPPASQSNSTTVNPMPSPQAPAAAATKESSASLPLDANSCSTTDLLSLPNMNVAAARAIVSEREEHGPYQSLEQLIARNDLKPHVVAAFISNLYVAAPSATPTSSQHVRKLDL